MIPVTHKFCNIIVLHTTRPFIGARQSDHVLQFNTYVSGSHRLPEVQSYIYRGKRNIGRRIRDNYGRKFRPRGTQLNRMQNILTHMSTKLLQYQCRTHQPTPIP